MLRKIALVPLLIIVICQFYRPNKNTQKKSTNDDFLVVENAPKNIALLYTNSCYDCHSNYTNYEWFDHVAPISWFVDNNIKNGIYNLNFSDWGSLDDLNKEIMFSAILFNIETEAMPKKSYTQFHPKAVLSENNKKQMMTWIKKIKTRFLKKEDLKLE